MVSYVAALSGASAPAPHRKHQDNRGALEDTTITNHSRARPGGTVEGRARTNQLAAEPQLVLEGVVLVAGVLAGGAEHASSR